MEKIAAKGRQEICLLLLAMAAIIIGGCGSSSSSPPYNITGDWSIYLTTNGATGEEGPDLYVFSQSETSLSATIYPQDLTATGSVDDLNVSFSWTGTDSVVHKLSGTEDHNGTTISGTWTTTNGQSGTWFGLFNTAPSTNIAGNWNVSLSGQQGSIPFTFTQSSNSLGTGTLGGTTSGQQVVGTISGLNVLFFWTGSDSATYTATGTTTTDGKSMSGSWTNSNGQSGTWSATKSS
jgi:hypothetical protein